MKNKICIISNQSIDSIGCSLIIRNLHKDCEIVDVHSVHKHVYSTLHEILLSSKPEDRVYVIGFAVGLNPMVTNVVKSRNLSCTLVLYGENGTSNKMDKELLPFFDNLVSSIDAFEMHKKNKYFDRGDLLNLLLQFVGVKKFLEVFSRNLDADFSDQIFSEVTHLVKENRDAFISKIIQDQVVNASRYMDCLGKTFIVLLSTTHIPHIGEVALSHPSVTDVAYVVIANPVTNNCTLYARKDSGVDVSQVAKKFHGNGGKLSAGFNTKINSRIEYQVSKLLSS